MLSAAAMPDPATVLPPEDHPMRRFTDEALDEMVAASVTLGHDIVDVAGFLDDVDRDAAIQITRLSEARSGADGVAEAAEAMFAATERLGSVMGGLIEVLGTSTGQIDRAVQESQQVMAWVGSVSDHLARIDEAMRATRASNGRILDIAREIKLLAINAKIEAARAGDTGRGFAVVAGAVTDLSAQTTETANHISETVQSLADQIAALRAEAEGVVGRAERGMKDLAATEAALTKIGSQATEGGAELRAMSERSRRMRAVMQGFGATFRALYDGITTQSKMVSDARDRVGSLIRLGERMVQHMFSLGGANDDRPMIEAVMDGAARLGHALGVTVDQGRITEAELFSTTYQKVPGTDPQQFIAPFTDLTDRLFPPVQEDLLTLDPRVVFCAAVNRTGYLPTHNRKFSAPQGADPVWNAANCRNRRIFDDRVGLTAGQSQEPFVMQIYRRDMGGGQHVMMKDVSAPIFVRGRHWGGLRLAYRFEK